MSTVAEHYGHHLGPTYVSMVGGAEAAQQAGSAGIGALHLPITRGAVVLDLGAGCGMRSNVRREAGMRNMVRLVPQSF